MITETPSALFLSNLSRNKADSPVMIREPTLVDTVNRLAELSVIPYAALIVGIKVEYMYVETAYANMNTKVKNSAISTFLILFILINSSQI